MTKEPTQTITNIKAQQKNKNRVNIYLDGKYAFPLELEAVFEFDLKKGKELTSKEIESLILESELEKLVAKSINFISYRPRSTKEVEDRLYKYTKDHKDNRDILIKKTIESLNKKRLINDQEFAVWFIEQRIRHKPRSKIKLISELRSKGLDKKTIDKALKKADFNEINSLNKLIEKNKHKKSEKSLISYLLRKGFKYQDIKANLPTTPSSS